MKDSLRCILFFGLLQLLWLTCGWAQSVAPEQAVREYRQENFEEAAAILEPYVAAYPDNGVAWYYLGLASKQMGDSERAATALGTAATSVPPVLDAYPDLIEVLYSLGRYDEALGWVDKAEAVQARPARIAFLSGMIHARQGESKVAAADFERAKALDKGLSQAADVQIAMLYAKERRLGAAREVLQQVIQLNPESDLARFARDYERNVSQLLESHRDWRLTLGLSGQYDDNVIAKPSTDIPGLVVSDEEDLSLVASLLLNYNPIPVGPWRFGAQYRFNTNHYFDLDSHRSLDQSLTLLPGYDLSAGQGALSCPLSYRYSLLDGQEYQGLLSVAPTYTASFAPQHIGQIWLGYSQRTLFQSALIPEEERDSDLYSLGLAYLHPFAEGGGMFQARYEWIRDDADGYNWRNDTRHASVLLLYPLAQTWRISLIGDLNEVDYDNRHTVFGTVRRDTLLSGSVTLTWDATPKLAVIGSVLHTTANSNLPVYDYDRNVVSLGFEYRF